MISPASYSTHFTLIALALVAVSPLASAETRVAQENGGWPGIAWSPDGNPTGRDEAEIPPGRSVEYMGPRATKVGKLLVGGAGNQEDGEAILTISDGTITAGSNGSQAIVVGAADKSSGVLKMSGGVLKTDGDKGGWLNIAGGSAAQGLVELQGGSIEINLNAAIGGGVGSLGKMVMTGGVFGVQGDFFVARPITSSSGEFEQSGGDTSIVGTMRIGNATKPAQDLKGNVRLLGGSFSIEGPIAVGRFAGKGGTGSGVLAFGPELEFGAGSETYIEVNGNGELRFELGSQGRFQTLDLSSGLAEEVLRFQESDARISVDGSELGTAQPSTIALISFAEGQGPSEESRENIEFAYTGFAEGWKPELRWTDTGLELQLGR